MFCITLFMYFRFTYIGDTWYKIWFLHRFIFSDLMGPFCIFLYIYDRCSFLYYYY